MDDRRKRTTAILSKLSDTQTSLSKYFKSADRRQAGLEKALKNSRQALIKRVWETKNKKESSTFSKTSYDYRFKSRPSSPRTERTATTSAYPLSARTSIPSAIKQTRTLSLDDRTDISEDFAREMKRYEEQAQFFVQARGIEFESLPNRPIEPRFHDDTVDDEPLQTMEDNITLARTRQSLRDVLVLISSINHLTNSAESKRGVSAVDRWSTALDSVKDSSEWKSRLQERKMARLRQPASLVDAVERVLVDKHLHFRRRSSGLERRPSRSDALSALSQNLNTEATSNPSLADLRVFQSDSEALLGQERPFDEAAAPDERTPARGRRSVRFDGDKDALSDSASASNVATLPLGSPSPTDAVEADPQTSSDAEPRRAFILERVSAFKKPGPALLSIPGPRPPPGPSPSLSNMSLASRRSSLSLFNKAQLADSNAQSVGIFLKMPDSLPGPVLTCS